MHRRICLPCLSPRDTWLCPTASKLHKHLSSLSRSLARCSLSRCSRCSRCPRPRPRSALPCLDLWPCLSRERLRFDLDSRRLSPACCRSLPQETGACDAQQHTDCNARSPACCRTARVPSGCQAGLSSWCRPQVSADLSLERLRLRWRDLDLCAGERLLWLRRLSGDLQQGADQSVRHAACPGHAASVL